MVRNGVVHTVRLLAPKPKARPVDLSGRRIVVTGASAGSLGHETARALAGWGARVVVTALKDPAALKRTLRDRLRADGCDPARVAAHRLDLRDGASVATFARWYREEHGGLDVLVNNAGILLDTFARRRAPLPSADGFEIHWRTNYLGTFQLTAALLPLLVESGRATGDARVVNIVSHQHTRGRNEGFFRPGTPAAPYHSWNVYGQSKLGLIHLTTELQRRHGANGSLRAVAVHPGSAYTNMIARGIAATPGLKPIRGFATQLAALVLLNPAQGAQTAIHCASGSGIVGGAYYERCTPVEPSADARNAVVAARLWEQSEAWMAGLPH